VFLLNTENTPFLHVFEGPQPSGTASGHAGSMPILIFISALVFSLATDPDIIHHSSQHKEREKNEERERERNRERERERARQRASDSDKERDRDGMTEREGRGVRGDKQCLCSH